MQLDDDCKLPVATCNYADHITRSFDYAYTCILGVNPRERVTPQGILINLLVCTPANNPLNKQNEHQLEHIITHYIECHAPQLLEHMAYCIGKKLIDECQKIIEISLVIKKPEAISCAKNSFVQIRMSASSEC